MKKLNNIGFILLIFFLFGASGCSKVLDQVPNDRIDLENYFKDRTDAEAALIGAYDIVFRNLAPTFTINSMLSGREIQNIGNIQGRQVQFRPVLRVDNDGGTGALWNQCYQAISRINLLLERVPEIPENLFALQGVPATTNRKNEILGEALFLRAWVYWQMALNWGDVPLILNFPTSAQPSNNLVSRTPVAQVYAQVDKDLQDAVTYLPVNHRFIGANLSAIAIRIASKGRATRGMALLMQARRALELKQWQLAADKANQIITLGEFSLNPLFTQTFNNIPSGGQNTTESILETQSVRDGFDNTGGIFAWEFYTNGRTEVTPGWYNNYSGTYLDPLDVRQLFSINIAYNANNSLRGFTLFKYYNRDGAFSSADPWNYVLGRLGEVFLIRAEALNELGFPNDEAVTRINSLRARARETSYTITVRRQGRSDTTVFAKGIPPASLTPAQPNTIFIANQEDFRNFIRDERWRELAFEGHQWYDLRRYNILSGKYSAIEAVYLNNPAIAGTDPGKILWPIPNGQIIVNPNLTQNPGY